MAAVSVSKQGCRVNAWRVHVCGYLLLQGLCAAQDPRWFRPEQRRDKPGSGEHIEKPCSHSSRVCLNLSAKRGTQPARGFGLRAFDLADSLSGVARLDVRLLCLLARAPGICSAGQSRGRPGGAPAAGDGLEAVPSITACTWGSTPSACADGRWRALRRDVARRPAPVDKRRPWRALWRNSEQPHGGGALCVMGHGLRTSAFASNVATRHTSALSPWCVAALQRPWRGGRRSLLNFA